MFDWLFVTHRDLPVWGVLLLDAVKVLLGFLTVLLVTRWTLSRADRKDAISRQANALDAYCARRILSLHKAVLALANLWTQLNKIYGAMCADLSAPLKAKAIRNLLAESEAFIDDLTWALEEYGEPPASLPSDYENCAEALTAWLRSFYTYRSEPLTEQNVSTMIGMCKDLQAQLRILGDYEQNMRLQVALNPASAWNPNFGDVLEKTALEFFTKDGPRDSSRPAKVIGTIVEQNGHYSKKEQRLRSRRILILGTDRVTDNLKP